MPMVKLPLTLAHGLLGFVRQQPLHGYEIAQRLRATEDLGLIWGWKQSQVYAELARLAQEGYLTSTVEVQATRPARKVFQLTALGVLAFVGWIASPVPHERDVQRELPLKLYFAQQEDPAAVQVLLARQQAVCQSWLATLHAQELPPGAGQHYAQLVQQFRLSQTETVLAWLATCGETGA